MSAKKITEAVTPRIFVDRTEIAEAEKMECGAKELEAIRLSLAYGGMIKESFEAMKERLKTLPKGIYRWKTAMTNLDVLNRMIEDSLPAKTWGRLRREQQTCAWEYKPVNPIRDVYTLVENSDVKVLIDQIISDNCAMCLKERKEWRGCKLRKTMIQISPPSVIRRDSSECPYQIVARNCEYGDYMNTEHRVIGGEDGPQTRRG